MIDEFVDRFVNTVNTHYREPYDVDINESPWSVLTGELEEWFTCDWAIKPYAPAIQWVEAIERRLDRKFPAIYRSLVTRYIFPHFEAGGVKFFGNTPEGTDFFEFRNRLFSEDLFPALRRERYLQIGQPAYGDYDPVSFIPYEGEVEDAVVVQIDHEGILIDNEIMIVREIAPSLRSIMNLHMEAAELGLLTEE